MNRRIWIYLICSFAILTKASAQGENKCNPLFTALANHVVKSCESREFDELEVYPKPGAKTEIKKGEYMKIAYAFGGEFNSRPAAAQIYQNYVNAITKAGGEVTSNNNNGVCGKIMKGSETYWVKINTDGSSWYWYESLHEASLRQDVVLRAEEIRDALKDDGRATFYGIYFDTDKATLKPDSKSTLESIAAFLKSNASANFFVVGHTDNTGSFERNLSLSKERATAVVNELTGTYGVNTIQLTAQGIASLAPVSTNDTDAGKAKNRRVELVKK